MAKLKKIYALGIGIDNYPAPVPALKGCKQDIDLVKSYLKEVDGVEVHFLALLDEQATRKNIIRYFIEHLGKAGPNDTALFYFAGHGTTEQADPVFWKNNPDRVLQGIVPIDGVEETPEKTVYRLIADKELRYLIGELSIRQSHLVTIFDCCHSGLNTRPTFRKRQFPTRTGNVLQAFPSRPWEAFIFGSAISKTTAAEQPIDEWLPEGRHIQMAACLPEESAYEKDGNGVFTAKLIEVLRRSRSQVTYFDLQSRIRNFLKSYFRQTPYFYTAGGYPDEVYRFFLDLPVTGPGREVGANVQQTSDGKWKMDIGHIQGVSRMAKTATVIDAITGQAYEAHIGKIDPTETELYFEVTEPDGQGHYYAYIKRYLTAPVKFFIEDQTKMRYASDWFTSETEGLSPQIAWADNPYEAAYRIIINDQWLVMTPGEDPDKPIAANISVTSPTAVATTVQRMNHIGQWVFVKDLHNPNSFLFRQAPILFELIQEYEDGTTSVLKNQNGRIMSDFEHLRDGEWGGKMKIRLTNRMDRPLFVSLIYLSMNFMIFTRMLQNAPVVKVKPGQSIWALDGKSIKIQPEQQVLKDNWKYSFSYFKVIASTDFFDVATLDQDPLPAPYEERYRAGRKPQSGQLNDRNASDWITQNFEVLLRNPTYRQVSQ